MKSAIFAGLAACATAIPANNASSAVRTSSWCFGAPLEEREGAPLVARREGKEFRGGFRDFTLWLEDSRLRDASCQRFGQEHTEGNDGLWVIEYDEEELMLKERARMAEVGIDIVAEHKKTIVVGGGEAAADKLGYDACGAEQDKRFISVPQQDVRGPKAMPKEVKDYYSAKLEHKQQINLDLLEVISEDALVERIAFLQEYESRNSFSQDNGLNQAVEYAEAEFLSYGFETERFPFREDMTAQVHATLRGTESPDTIVVVGAHFDSRGTQSTSPTQRAPGADDNGSGSASVLEFARVIHATGATFKHTLKLMLFTGEEQGLIGSRAIAAQMAEDGENVIAMFNADMIGYAPEGDAIILAYMNRFADLDLTELSRQATELYVPEVQTDLTNVCCSDQQSFFENGFSSVGFFETPNPTVVYPQYHTSDDLLQFLSAEKIYLLTKATLASAIVFAEPIEFKHKGLHGNHTNLLATAANITTTTN